jgi:hypothetical protein
VGSAEPAGRIVPDEAALPVVVAVLAAGLDAPDAGRDVVPAPPPQPATASSSAETSGSIFHLVQNVCSISHLLRP